MLEPAMGAPFTLKLENARQQIFKLAPASLRRHRALWWVFGFRVSARRPSGSFQSAFQFAPAGRI